MAANSSCVLGRLPLPTDCHLGLQSGGKDALGYLQSESREAEGEARLFERGSDPAGRRAVGIHVEGGLEHGEPLIISKAYIYIVTL